MKKKILVEAYPAYGHYNAILLLAKALSDNYDFVFIGPQEFARKVTDAGFDFKIAQINMFEPMLIRANKAGWWSNFSDQYLGSKKTKIHYDIEASIYAYDKLLSSIEPDLIFLDDHLAMKSLFYAKYDIPVIIIQTMIPAHYTPDAPPFQSMYIPHSKNSSASRIKWEWRKYRAKRFINHSVWKLVTNAQTDFSVYINHLNYAQYKIDTSTCFNPVISDLEMITTIPRQFEFPFVNHRNLHYVTLSPQHETGSLGDPRMESFIQKVKSLQQADQQVKLIYVSLGTVTDNFKKTSVHFFQQIVRLAETERKYFFILSLSVSFDINEIRKKPDNVIMFKHVPQKLLLNQVDAMINHGGPNTIKECIHAHVPMLLYPLSNKWDQPGSAARAAFHGLGIAASMKNMNAKSIRQNLQKLFTHYDTFKTNIKIKDTEMQQDSVDSITRIQHVIRKHLTAL